LAPTRRGCSCSKREGVDLINKIGLTERGEEQGLLREREEAAQAVARVERSDTGCGFPDFASLNPGYDQ
jgi:hypothetical protein